MEWVPNSQRCLTEVCMGCRMMKSAKKITTVEVFRYNKGKSSIVCFLLIISHISFKFHMHTHTHTELHIQL